MFPLSFLKLAIWFFSEILIVLVWAVLICWYTELCLYICNTYIFEWMQYPNEYMKTVPEWGKNLSEIFFGIFMKSAVSRIVPKNVKGGPFGIFGTTILLQNIKIEAGTLWRHWKHLRKKVSQSRNTMHKNFGHGRDSNPRPFAWQTSKNPS